MADSAGGLRQRKKAPLHPDDDEVADRRHPHEDTSPAAGEEEYGTGEDGDGVGAGEEGNGDDADNYGYQPSDEEYDEEDDRLEDENEGEHEDEDDEEGEGGSSGAQGQPMKVRATAAPLDAPDPNDWYLLLAGLLGFLVAGAGGAILPVFGVQQDYVMAGGMLTLLGFLVWVSFCPSCCTRAKPAVPLAPVEQITPSMVFFVTACLGTMIGGLVGGGVKHAFYNSAFQYR